MRVYEKNNNLIFEGVSSFDLVQILESGQFFRYREGDFGYLVNVLDRQFCIAQNADGLVFYGCNLADKDFICTFFDLDRDYDKIKADYAKIGDENIVKATEFGSGIRILKQDFFEMLITFIISQNNNIPRIKGIVERLCECFGEKKCSPYGDYYAFPTAQCLAALSAEDLAPIRAGFRAQYIVNGAKAFCEGRFENISSLSYEDAKKLLLTVKGVGEKVANCVLLFGNNRLSAFPVDVWIKRTVDALYGESFSPDMFGDTAGIAQQYLFYYSRKNGIV